jgi:hypothetical protein
MTTPPVSGAQLLKRMRKTSDPEAQAEVDFYLEAATEAAEEWKNTGPIIIRTVTEDVYTTARRALIVTQRPVVSVTTATRIYDGTVYVTADLDVDKEAGIITGKDWWLLSGGYSVVYEAGRAATPESAPASLKMAVLIIAEHNMRTKQGPRTRAFRGQQPEPAEEFRTSNGFLIPRAAAGYLRGQSDPFLIG